ncbi:uncharacterized protein C8A04DRAFT_25869 [Dichotomopilus funicola]|uniref:RNase MRP protein 1 RNA binding domain-containing protein n=1 Tax=Dichotomopilus funicola TaxID=1934379 RepID=A0AAN6V8E3_9PEZI|nr:hypothetical protein C8A04DRAFT_25869 [Dichotomopilus funicola]
MTATKITQRPSSHPNSTPDPATTPTTTTPTSKADPALTAQTSLATLTPALHLLERAHHRNKNQHRLSGWWWARADMLRRGVRKLVGELEELIGDGGGDSEKKMTRGKGRGRGKGVAEGGRGLLEKVERRAGFLRWSLGPGAFVAFTQLAADKNFAQLGLMLLGVLAQIDQALAPFAPAPVNGAAGDVGQEAVVRPDELLGASAPNEDTEMADDVMGVAVSREEVMASIEGDDTFPQTSASTPLPHSEEREPFSPETRPQTISIPTHTVSSKKQLTSESRLERQNKAYSTGPDEPAQLKKKKKKIKSGGDEFDDIFGTSEPISKPKKKRPKLEGGLDSGSVTRTGTRTNKTDDTTSIAPDPSPPMTLTPAEPPPKKKTSSKARVGNDEFDGIFGSLDDDGSGGDAEENTKKKSDKKEKKEKVKKKRKRGDEFDDIFRGL